MTLKIFCKIFGNPPPTAAFWSSSVDPPFQETTDHGLIHFYHNQPSANCVGLHIVCITTLLFSVGRSELENKRVHLEDRLGPNLIDIKKLFEMFMSLPVLFAPTAVNSGMPPIFKGHMTIHFMDHLTLSVLCLSVIDIFHSNLELFTCKYTIDTPLYLLCTCTIPLMFLCP